MHSESNFTAFLMKYMLMKNTFLRIFAALAAVISGLGAYGQSIDMQAHVWSDEGRTAYSEYQTRQDAYYTDACAYDSLLLAEDTALFHRLNTLLGATCRLLQSSYNYGSLRSEYVNVDRDLNTPGNIIGYYDGCTLDGTWDSGHTWNREHTWPQSKGASNSIPMGYDMQSVRPASTDVNSDRGNTPYGESTGYYDPDEVAINNTSYRIENRGTYRGDAARVILYDYLLYGTFGGHQNALYNGNAQLPDKLGYNGVFESFEVLLRWHMQDPPSLTEMVRNDGGEVYQGNRNPFIDFPEIAVLLLKNQPAVTTYPVQYSHPTLIHPHHPYSTAGGFVCYVTEQDGSHPANLSVEGAEYDYDSESGRLTITRVNSDVTVTVSGVFESLDEAIYGPAPRKYFRNGRLVILQNGTEFDVLGQPLKNHK